MRCGHPADNLSRSCASCGTNKRASATSSYCKPCNAAWARARNKKRIAAGESTHSPSQLREKYGCSPEEYKERMATSDSCEVCGSIYRLQYDHCHDTMKFRGVLCWECNSGIGKLGDTLEGLRRALNYLEERQ